MKMIRKLRYGGGITPTRHCEAHEQSKCNEVIHLPYRHCEILRRRIVAIHLIIAILTFTIPPNLNAIELTQICQINSSDTYCKLNKTYSEVTNSSAFAGYIQLSQGSGIDTFINYGDITDKYKDYTNTEYTFSWDSGYISNVINYGAMGGFNGNRSGAAQDMPVTITNYGKMKGINTAGGNTDIIIDNYGVIYMLWQGATWYHLSGGNYDFVLKNYAITIQRDSNTFNTGVGRPDYEDNSHLIVKDGKIRFQDANSKIILDFGENFEFGKEYSLNRLIMDTGYWAGGTWKTVLPVEFYRLTTKSDIYYLTQRGQYFIAKLAPEHSTIGNLYKANIRTMNNFYTISNSMIFPRKSQNLRSSSLRASVSERGNPFALSSLRADSQNLHSNPPYEKSLDSALDSTLDSAIPLKSYESFSYRNEAQNRRIQRQNKRSYSRQSRNLSQNLNTDSANQTNKTNKNNLLDSANRDYYFILTPFINYNSFNKAGNYNLSGFDYGFLTAFSAKIAESNHLGTHFIFSYGKLGDRKDKDLSIKSLNLNLGINYKLDLIWDMYLKARGDFFYFLNQVSSASVAKTNADNLGFGLSVSYGKDFDFRQGGVLGLEVALDYKALKTNEVSLNSQHYKQSLLNLIYADVGVNYNKYFGDFGINLGTGFKANLAPKLAKSALLVNTQNLQFTIDNDKYLAYANAGISYMLNHKNFDMEFSLAYYGNFGDKGISNGGGVEWRTTW